MMQMCARCHQRVAVVFISRLEDGKTVNEGICLRCARELGIKPVNDMLDKMGISEEDFDRMSAELGSFLGDKEGLPSVLDAENGEEGGAPAIELPKIFQSASAGGEKAEEAKTKSNDKKAAPKRKYLSTYCQNLTDRAKEGKLDRIVGRDRELARLIQILCRRQKNNPCLIGEPGVGKTAIAEALASRIAAGDVPYRLKECEVHLLDLTALVAGTQFRGQFEARVLGLLNEVKAAGNIILVIDEVHNIVGAGEGEGSMNAANILKPALSRGEVQIIGATTLKEYRKFIEKDTALERRFQPIMVNEPSVADSVEVLRGIKDYYETYHGIVIPDAVLYQAVMLSERYITDRYLPDKAIDLLDEAASHVSLSSDAVNEKRRVDKELKLLYEEKTAAESMPDGEDNEEKYRRLADVKVKELQLLEKQAELEKACAAVTLTNADLAGVIEIWTGIPASTVRADEFERLETLEERLREHIVGQDEAVAAVTRAIKRSRAGVSARRAPVSFIFAGPTGVGKTELVKVLAADLFHQPETLVRLDMSEFMEKHSVSKIIGAPPGYVGHDEAGQLTEKIRRRPYSVVLFDEIEKAHPDVLNILLQILDEGKVTDAQGRVVNFENTLIVMTTNAGAARSGAVSGFGESTAEFGKENTERALSSFLRPEFLNRVDEIITFRHLSEDDFGQIAVIMLEELKAALLERGITLVYDDAASALVAKESYSFKYGARHMRRYIRKTIEDPIAEEIIRHYAAPVKQVVLTVEGEKFNITCQS